MSRQIRDIIIAEDDIDDVELFSQALSEVYKGVNLRVAENGIALMKLLAGGIVPDIIILDMNMPFKNGRQCLEEIRSQKKFDNVPVVILSTSDRVMNETTERSGELNYFYKKPWLYPDLKQLVLRICKGKFDTH